MLFFPRNSIFLCLGLRMMTTSWLNLHFRLHLARRRQKQKRKQGEASSTFCLSFRSASACASLADPRFLPEQNFCFCLRICRNKCMPGLMQQTYVTLPNHYLVLGQALHTNLQPRTYSKMPLPMLPTESR